MTRLKKYEIIGVIVVTFIASVLGYIFLKNPGNYGILDFLVPKNSSLWELSKILFLALTIYAIFEYFVVGKEYNNYGFAKGVSIVLAPVIFLFITYIMDLIIGNVFIWTHLLTFFISIVFAQVVSHFFMHEKFYFKLMNVFGIFALIALLTIFASYTATPELLPFFEPMERYEEIILR
ncbi:MAG: DUF6512 family protein [Bacilli bacterium]